MKKVLRLKEALAERRISGKDLAEKIEMTETSISRMLNGGQVPKVETLLKIAEVLDVDVRDLFEPTKENETERVYVKREGEFVEVGNISFSK